MTLSRRDFMTLAAASGAAGMLPRQLAADRAAPYRAQATRLLVLGGTGFIGPHMVQAALDEGFDVTIFNRGRSNTHLFPDVERLVGDRSNDLESLKGREWDVVIDNSATLPTWVRLSTDVLKDTVGRYFFTSTRSVIKQWREVGLTAKTAELHSADPSAVDTGTSLGYGPNKVLCEREVRLKFGDDRTLIVRPGLIVGPGDRTDRFTYWPVRVDQGGEVLAPGEPTYPAMFIDVRDLAEWYVRLIVNDVTGIYMGLGPLGSMTFAELLYGCRAVTSTPVQFTWVDTDFLLGRDMRPYSDFPVWMPPRGDRAGFQRFDMSEEVRLGLTYRPFAVTAYDTLEYHKGRPAEARARLRSGITREKETELLQAWHATHG